MKDAKQTTPGSEEATSLTLAPGVVADEYRVLRLIGRGGTGEVYLAQDTRLGRKVALKVVTQEALRHPTARERFLREARVTAQFSHPHIVVIHGAGEVDDYPYLALEYLPGQTLRERMDERRPGLREALRFGLAMVDALAEAHRHHVLHRDLKPQNIIIPRDGRLRVVDFGLAKRLPAVEPHPDHGEGGHGEGGHGEGGHGEGVAEVLVPEGAEDSSTTATTVHQDFPSQTKGILGTPAYMAPEQWQKGPVSGATDIWAFGIVLHELFSGRHPFQGAGFYQLCHLACSSDPIPSLAQTAETLPPALIELVDRCLSKSPKNRPSAVEASKVLERLLSGTDRRVQENPFRGLLPFAERHADLFFGREVEIDTFLEQLRTETVLPVVGPSGAGKSSFVQAGVIPRLREQGSWLVLRMRPGRQPFETLAARLTAGESTMRHSSSSGTGREWETSEDSESLKLAEDKLAARLAEVPERLSLELASLAKNQRVLLFVDQLEELYTLVDSEQTRRGFMQALCATAGDPAGALRVVFTLRDDFLGRMADGAQAREALSHVTVLRAPGPLALRETLERPVAAGGYTFEDAGLPEEMVSEVAGEDAALPLLQFAGQQLWERRDQDRHLLTRRAHTEMGGVAGALAQHTDATLGGLSPDQERIAQRIFIRLVTPDLTRQVLPHSQLLEGLGPGAEKVLERLTNARTILVRKGSHEAELELVHESLIRNWDRLARWLDESREERQFLSEVGRAADLWERRGRSEAEVWQGDALTESLLKARMCPTLPGSVPRFLAAGEARRDRAHKRRRLLWTGAFILVVLIALVAVAVSLLVRRKEREAVRQRQTAQLQKRRAEQKQREAIGHRAAALREGARAALAHQSLVEARAKLRSALELGDSPLGRVLWQRISHHPLRWKRAPGANLVAVAYSPDGKHVAAASQDHAVYLINVASGGVQTLRGHKDQVMRVAFSPDGKWLASASWKGAIRIWNVRTGRSRTLAGHGARIWGLTFDPSGRRLASACESDEIRLWDTASGRQLRLIRVAKARLSDVAFSPDGRRLATASFDKTVRLFDAQNGHLLRVLKGHTGRLWGVAFRPPLGRQVASAGMDRTIRIWDAGSGRLIRTLSGHQAEVYRVHYSADGKLLASASDDKTIRIWDASSGRLIRTLTGHESRVWEAAFSPSGRLLVSASTDNTARLWDLRNAAPPAVSRGHSSSVDGVDFSPDSRLLASASTDNTVRLWDVATGGQLHVLRHQAQAWDVAFHPQGQHLVSTSSDRTLRIWKVRTGRLVRTLKGHRSTVRGVAYSPDGGLIASASDDKTVRIWDADTGAPGKVLRGHEAAAWGADFSADGRILSSASADRTVRLWDVKTGRLRRVLRGHSAPVWTVHFRRDGQRLVTASSDKTARIWNARTGALISTLGPYPYRIYNAQFQGEGLLIGVTSSDRKARIITLASRKTVVLAGHGGDANSIAFSPNGRYAATTSDDTTVRLWDVATGRPVWRAPLLRTNPPELYSHRGWQRLDGQPGPKTPRRRKWRQAVANGARYAAQAGRWLCLSTGDELEVWDTAEDRRIQRVALGGLVRLIAFAGEGRQGGCVTLAHSIARLHRFGAAARPVQILRRDAVTIGLSPGRILVASPSGVHLYSRSGAALRHITAQMGIRAVAQVGDQLVLGFKDGGIELIPLQRQQQHHRRSNFRFAKTPSGPVTRLAQGPMGTLVAGYANGEFGLWSMANGDRLLHRRLHGPVAHLLVHKQKLYAASILGQHQTLDLAALYTPYCQLLRLVWKSIPIIWENGLPLRKAPSKNHHCR